MREGFTKHLTQESSQLPITISAMPRDFIAIFKCHLLALPTNPLVKPIALSYKGYAQMRTPNNIRV